MAIETYRHLFNYLTKKPRILETELMLNGVVSLVEDCKGYKVSFLKDILTPRFSGYSYGDYSLTAKFKCLYHNHEIPNLNCTCGFYSFKDISEAKKLLAYREGSVLLEVEHYGDIIEHSKGYRASEQEILSINFPKTCHRLLCRREAGGVTHRFNNWMQVCVEHASDSFHTFRELRLLMPVEINLI